MMRSATQHTSEPTGLKAPAPVPCPPHQLVMRLDAIPPASRTCYLCVKCKGRWDNLDAEGDPVKCAC